MTREPIGNDLSAGPRSIVISTIVASITCTVSATTIITTLPSCVSWQPSGPLAEHTH